MDRIIWENDSPISFQIQVHCLLKILQEVVINMRAKGDEIVVPVKDLADIVVGGHEHWSIFSI